MFYKLYIFIPRVSDTNRLVRCYRVSAIKSASYINFLSSLQEFYVSKQYQHLYQMKIFKNPQESDYRYLKVTKNDQKEQKNKMSNIKEFCFCQYNFSGSFGGISTC